MRITMNDTTATIQFIGLCLFANQRAGKGVTALLPCCIPRKTSRSKKKISTLVPVEDHSAIILFRETDLRTLSGWEARVYEPDPAFRYVCLGGETVTLHTTRRPKAVTLERTNLRLPHLIPCCERMRKQAPKKRLADATIAINQGILNSCAVTPTHEEPIERTDTWLAIENTETLTIRATKSRTKTRPRSVKTLVFNGNANVFVSNLPSHMVQDHEHDSTATLHDPGTPHYEAYYSLLSHDARCSRNRGFADRPELIACHMKAPKLHFAATAEAVSSECSNSQWP
jgi:hypothetical protein